MLDNGGKGKNLQKLITTCIQNNIPFTSFSMPGKMDITTFVQVNSLPGCLDDNIESENDTGFVFAPFEKKSEQYKKWLLKPDYIFKNDNIDPEIINYLNEKAFDNDKGIDVPETTTELEFVKNVEQIIKEINADNLAKVVLSRTKVIKVDNIKEIIAELFIDLDNTYPNAFCFIANLPNAGFWMGASPEPLLFLDNQSFHTVALAGTKYLNGVPVDNVEWSVKEIHEQAVVSHYIEEKLQTLKAEIKKSKGPFNAKAAKLVHLKTDFFFDMPECDNRLNILLTALHPTPSVCGLPVEDANATINKLEKHQRSYYSGFLGPLNYNNTSNIFVNLRCLQVINNHIVLYSGAGITGQSEPKKEWKETEHKLETMLSVIKTKIVV